MIEIKNLRKEYAQKRQRHIALNGINLSIAKGEIFGIIGRSGAGKSTLIRCINLLECPSDGNININGINLSKLSTSELRQERHNIGMIFQHFNLLSSRTVAQNIAFPLEIQKIAKPTIKARVEELIELTGLNQKADAYPEQLSGGQKQRVAIARALASNPKILLSDEATSSLDPETTNQILQLLKTINQKFGITIVIITHEMHVIRSICDKVAIINHGVIEETNTVTELFLNPKTEIAKSFTETNMNLKLPEEIKNKLYSDPYHANNLSPVVKVTFLGEQTQTPLIAELSKEYLVECNIIQANIERIHEQTIGICIFQIIGNKDKWESALKFLNTNNLKAEVIGYATTDAF